MKKAGAVREAHRRWGDGGVVRETCGQFGNLNLRVCEVGFIEYPHAEPWLETMTVVASSNTWVRAFKKADEIEQETQRDGDTA